MAAAWLSRGLERGSALRPEELSIACASHAGEPRHVAVVEAWLKKTMMIMAIIAVAGILLLVILYFAGVIHP